MATIHKADEFFTDARTRPIIRAVALPGGDKIHVRTLTADEKDRYETQVYTVTGQGDKQEIVSHDVRATLVRMTACGPKGDLLFTDADIGRLKNMPSLVIEPIVKEARRLNGIGDEAAEEIGKNSGPTGDGGGS